MFKQPIANRVSRCSRYKLLTILLIAAANVYPQGTITTVAGTDWLFQGQGMPAKDAALGRSRAWPSTPMGTSFWRTRAIKW